jgi:hypothetical protein
MRRSATENCRNAGVHVRVGMDLVGHSTPAMHYQYDSAGSQDRAEGVRRLAAYVSKALTDTGTDTVVSDRKEGGV